MFSLNVQPAEKPDWRADGSLDVIDIWETIQGEGPFSGCPAVFVRLAGCNLDCPLCDTDYTTDRQRLTPKEIIAWIRRLRLTGLVVLTGGEPFRQNLTSLVWLLEEVGYQIQIETNGTLYLPGFPYQRDVTVVCSPKTGSIHTKLQPHVTALKYVIEAGQTDPEDGLPLSVLGRPMRVARPWPEFRGDVYIQPVDEGGAERNVANVQEAVNSCMKFGYRLSLQLHKIIGLP